MTRLLLAAVTCRLLAAVPRPPRRALTRPLCGALTRPLCGALTRPLLGAFALLLATAAPAAAAPAFDVGLREAEVRFGDTHTLSGSLTDGNRPLAGETVVLEARRYPYNRPFTALQRTRSDADGEFSFRMKLDRNHQLRVATAREPVVRSDVLRAYVFPAFKLTFRAVKPGVVRLVQRYTVPAAVTLTAPTRFYLGPAGAKLSSRVVSRPTRRVRAGRYSSMATVRLPKAWKGRFRYGSCFKTSRGSGMGDPAASCPARFRF